MFRSRIEEIEPTPHNHSQHWNGFTIDEINNIAFGIVVGLKQKYKYPHVEIWENKELIDKIYY